jgi:UDP-N-acetylmuramate--alanine ligase
MAGLNTKYHFTGIGGVGMSPLARLAIGLGAQVTGSDRAYDMQKSLPVLDQLQALGARLFPQDGQGVDSDTHALVVSTAIENDNPDMLKALEYGVPVKHRAELLSEFASGHPIYAVAGTAGKTTVTAMLGWVLDCLDVDPVVVNGGAVLNWQSASEPGSVRLSTHADSPWVLEVDESDRSLLHFFPDAAILTNISEDHFSLEEVEMLFDQFRSQVSGPVIEGQAEWAHHIGDAEVFQSGSRFSYRGVVFDVCIPGLHNAQNAFSVIRLCEELGHALVDLIEPIRAFRGVGRRLEEVLPGNPVKVFDDYAHNPAKIEAACRTLLPYCDRLHCLWRPHGFSPLAMMADELASMWASVLREDDQLYILPVYYAGGTVNPIINAESFVSQLTAKGLSARYCLDHADALEQITQAARPGDAVICMGARDPDLPSLARTIAQQCGK